MNRPRTARPVRWVALALAALVVAACTPTPPTNPAVSDVEIDGGNRSIAVGENVTLTATVTATGGAATTVTWSSSDPTVATIDATTGALQGIAAGTTDVTATSTFDATRSDTITVTVTAGAAVTDVEIDGGDRSVGIGDSVTLTATVTATGGAATTVTWSSSDPTVATIDATTGALQGIAAGTTDVTATSTFDATRSDTITVTVVATTVSIVGGDRSFPTGRPPVVLEAQTGGGAPATVTWSSDAPAVAAIGTNSGELTIGSAGSATITAALVSDPTATASIEVTVVGADPDDVYVAADAEPFGNGSAAFPFALIADAIVFVNVGGTVNVAAGTYAEALYVTKGFALEGAGESLVTIVADASAGGEFSTGAIDVDGILGLTGLELRGFTLQVDRPGPQTAAITVYRGASNVTIEDVTIVHDTDDQSNLHGINVGGTVGIVSNVTLRRVTIQATGDEVLPNEFTNGAGVNVEGSVTNMTIDALTTSGHERGLSLDPRNGTIDGVTIVANYAIAEINRMSVLYDGSGTVTNLDAPSFAAAVGNFTPEYGGNNWFFYKESIVIAIRDSMFNFTQAGAWTQSYVQQLDATDQSVRLPVFHIGRANGTPFGIGLDRNLLLQPAIDAAALLAVPATVVLQANVTSGALDPVGEPPVPAFAAGATVDVAGLTIQGAGGTSAIVASGPGPVLTIDAANVTITGVSVDGPATVGIATTAAAGGLSVTGSNLLTATALDNTAGATVTATGNYWGAASGPTAASNPGGTGNLLVDPGDDVDFTGFLGAAVP